MRQLVIALTALGLSACGQMGGGHDASFDGSIEDRPTLCNEGFRGFIEKGGVMRFDVCDPKTGKRLRPGRVASCHGV